PGLGLPLVRTDAAKGDAVPVRHILVPIVPQAAHLAAVDARTDTLDRLAADQTDGSRLASAAKRLHLPLARAPKLVEGARLRLGGAVPGVSVWAFEARRGGASAVTDAGPASFGFRLGSLPAAG